MSDLFPDRCAALAKACRCEKTYPSLEELVKDDTIEAVFTATDAPSHARHCIEVLKHGKHVATAVPATYGSLEDADKLFETVKASGRKYMMFETSYFHADLHAMRQIYNAGGFGKLVYSEGEYYHYTAEPIDSYKGWRDRRSAAMVPDALECLLHGRDRRQLHRSLLHGHAQPDRMAQGGEQPLQKPLRHRNRHCFAPAKVACRGWPSVGTRPATSGEMGRIRGQKGSFYGQIRAGWKRTCLPTIVHRFLPSVQAGGHGGSHGYLMNEFVTAILEDRQPLVDIAQALNMTVSGIVAHESALKDGELMKIPQYEI